MYLYSVEIQIEYPGYFTVINPASGNEYNVVYRGHKSPWNYCSCMDFKVSQLGTCKHLEGVKLWIREKRRKVCLRIGTDNEEEFRKLASPYFSPDGVMRPAAVDSYAKFGDSNKNEPTEAQSDLRQAIQLNPGNIWAGFMSK